MQNTTTVNTSALVRGIRRSDARAFRELFELFQEDIFRFLNYKLGSVEAAEDILQDVFVKLWENRLRLRDDVSIKSFLFTIANRTALNFLRHNRIVMRFELEKRHESPREETPYLELEKKDVQQRILYAIAKLPEKPRVAFMLSRFDELTYREVADRLDISIKTVECHIGKALKLLRAELHAVA